MRHLAAVAVLVAATLSTGCAALKPRPTSYTAFGEADPARDKSVLEGFDKLKEEPQASRPEVKVLVDTLPVGVDMKDGTISVEDGAPYELVGKFSIGTKGGLFPDYKDGWRKGLCYPQAPLVAVTLLAWAVVPTYWPCFTSGMMSRTDAIDAAKTLAWSAGANLVLLSYAGSGEEVGGGVGFLLKTDLSAFDPKQVRPKDAKSSPGEAAVTRPATLTPEI
ncbi:MAG: hypothetical protein IT380_13550 [Myxococcales bacterium]|nr:hypothetical protein [Myxococcales bacterium]